MILNFNQIKHLIERSILHNFSPQSLSCIIECYKRFWVEAATFYGQLQGANLAFSSYLDGFSGHGLPSLGEKYSLEPQLELSASLTILQYVQLKGADCVLTQVLEDVVFHSHLFVGASQISRADKFLIPCVEE